MKSNGVRSTKDWFIEAWSLFKLSPYWREMVEPSSSTRVLIVEDDIDLIRPLSRIFEQLGCQTYAACKIYDAYDGIRDIVPDIIILDWMLGTHKASFLLEQCEQSVRDDRDLQIQFLRTRPKVITFSATDEGLLKIPGTYFYHFDHWRKPFQWEELKRRARSATRPHVRGSETTGVMTVPA